MRKYNDNSGFGDWETLWGHFPFNGMSERLTGAGDTGISLERDGEEYVVFADIPGFEKGDVELRYEDGVLTVTGSHEMGSESEHAMRTRRVHEQVRVPGDVVVEDITATLKNGVLEVRLPLAGEHEESHHIDVE